VVAFRYLSSYPPTDVAFLERMRERLERFRAVPPVRALLAELRLAEERWQRGEPAHYPELITRLMRVAINQNTFLDERLADERDVSVVELQRLREDVIATAARSALPWRRRKLRTELAERFSSASFPFRHDRHVPRVVVRATAGVDALEPTFRGEPPWTETSKRALIERGYRLTDEALGETGELLRGATEGRLGPGQAVGPHAEDGPGLGRPRPDRD
jgi:hypothetical protein